MANKRGGGTPGFGGAIGAKVREHAGRSASYVTATSGRETAILLIVAIFLARLALTHQLQAFWTAMWGQPRPLGSALPKNVAAANSNASSNTASQPNVTASGTQTQTNTSIAPAAAAGSDPLGGIKSIIGRVFGGAA